MNMAYVRQSRPDSGLGIQLKVIETSQGAPSLLGTGHQRLAGLDQPRERGACPPYNLRKERDRDSVWPGGAGGRPARVA